MSERKLLAEKEVDAIEREAYVAFAPLPTMLAAVLNLIYTIRQQWDTIGRLQHERDEERLSRVSLERRVAELEGRGDDE